MLKKLRFKFVIINMTLITAMLIVIFGMIVCFTQENLESQSVQMLQTVANDPFQSGPPGTRRDEVNLPYFIVTVSPWADMLTVTSNSDSFDLSDEALLQAITEAALSSDGQVGVLREYSLRFYKSTSFMGDSIVFADISSELATMEDLIRTCVMIGVLGFLVFWFISLRLANWAIKPVEEAWAQQKQFVADASHELKTPLTVIMTDAELLQNPEYDEEAKERFSASILTMAQQMRLLVEGLLELARVDNGAVKTAFVQVDLSALVEDGCLPFEPLYFERGLMLESRVDPGIVLKGSPTHLEQVLKILLDNAMKYSEPGTVTVTLKRHAGGCLLTVSNPGAPMAPEDLKNIFKRFYRVDKARSRDGSYGLGLSIAENIVLEHGGRIWAESTAGQNIFHIQLPQG